MSDEIAPRSPFGMQAREFTSRQLASTKKYFPTRESISTEPSFNRSDRPAVHQFGLRQNSAAITLDYAKWYRQVIKNT